MKRAIAVIAAIAVLLPATALAQTRHRVVVAGTVTNAQQARRAEQGRRDYREEQTEKISRTLKIGNGGELDLSNLAGDITITRGGGNSVQI